MTKAMADTQTVIYRNSALAVKLSEIVAGFLEKNKEPGHIEPNDLFEACTAGMRSQELATAALKSISIIMAMGSNARGKEDR